MPEKIKIFKIVDGYRRGQLVDIIETYKVTLLGSPSGIKFDITGQTFSADEVIELEPGVYTYRAYSPNSNYVEKTGTFILGGSNTFLDVNLKFKERDCAFTVQDNTGAAIPGAEIVIDSQVVGLTNSSGLLNIAVSVGYHVINVRKTGMTFVSSEISIPDVPGTLTRTLIMTPFFDSSNGFISVFSNPGDQEVYIGGQLKGRTPYQATIQEGSYSLKVGNPGFVPYQSTFKIYRGSNTTVDIKIEKEYIEGSVTFTTNADNTSVYLDSSLVGLAPLTLKRLGGVYSYRAVSPNYFPTEGQVVIENGKNIVISLNLEKKPVTTVAPFPSAGTILGVECVGFDKYNRVANGSGGSSLELVEKNAAFCGAPITRHVKIVTNVDSNVKVTKNDVLIYERKTVLGNTSQSFETESLEMYINDTYNVTVTQKPIYYIDTLMGVKEYEPRTVTYKVPPSEPSGAVGVITVNLDEVRRANREAVFTFNFTEWSTNTSGEHTRGTGGIYIDSYRNTITGNARMLYDMYGPGDPVGNSTGRITLTIRDPLTGLVISSQSIPNFSYFNPNVSLVYSIPTGTKDLRFSLADAKREFNLVSSNSADNYVDWTGNTTFNWYTEAFQHFLYKESGTIQVTITVPFTYRI